MRRVRRLLLLVLLGAGPVRAHSVSNEVARNFVGRAAELALIDQWATGPNAMLLVQAIGGMGKSMLIWHWLRTRAAAV